MNAVIELEEAYNHYKNDPEFNRELTELFNEYAGRPSRLCYAGKMTRDLGGAKIYLKREDLPTIVRDFQSVISKEIKEQMMAKEGRFPDAVIACVGGGSNAIGSFYHFIDNANVRLIGCEAGH